MYRPCQRLSWFFFSLITGGPLASFEPQQWWAALAPVMPTVSFLGPENVCSCDQRARIRHRERGQRSQRFEDGGWGLSGLEQGRRRSPWHLQEGGPRVRTEKELQVPAGARRHPGPRAGSRQVNRIDPPGVAGLHPQEGMHTGPLWRGRGPALGRCVLRLRPGSSSEGFALVTVQVTRGRQVVAAGGETGGQTSQVTLG